MHLPNLVTCLKFCHDGNKLLTGDEACIAFHCSNKENCSVVQTAEAALGRSQQIPYFLPPKSVSNL